MSASQGDEPVFEPTEFEGDITFDHEMVPITLRVSTGPDCRLRLDADAVEPDAYFLVARNQGRPGIDVGNFALAGTSADGKTISSQSVVATGHGHNDERRWIKFKSYECAVMLPLESRVEKPVLRLWLRSFVSFRNPVIDTSLGRMIVMGEVTNVGADDVSGCIVLEAPSRDPGHEWRDNAEDFLRHMHRGLALAHGGRLQIPRVDFIHDFISEITFFDGTGFNAELPVQHSVNHGPFIKALAERYERAGAFPDTLWTALGWMQSDTVFDETRFLSGMTALEAIVESQLPQSSSTIIPKTRFRFLRQKIEQMIISDDTLSEEARNGLMGKIPDLNRKSFSQKMRALFDHYAIPKRDFEGGVIRDLVSLRNGIVHKGLAPNREDLWPSIILVRELITRILLKEIGFVGRYCCYIGGINDRDFPGEI